MKARPVKTVLIAVATSDRGLCGAFNTNLVNVALRLAREQEALGRKVHFISLAKKAASGIAFRAVCEYLSGSTTVPGKGMPNSRSGAGMGGGDPGERLDHSASSARTPPHRANGVPLCESGEPCPVRGCTRRALAYAPIVSKRLATTSAAAIRSYKWPVITSPR